MKTRIIQVVAALLLAVVTLTPANAEWKVDTAHTEVNFSIKHFFTPVTGSFEEFDVSLTFDSENPANSSVEATIPVASVNTGNERRDNHLRSGDWFEAEAHPNITFKSTSVRKEGDMLIATGPLTIKGVSQEIELPIHLLGSKAIPEQMQEMIGAKHVAGFEAETSIDRGDFGVGVGNWAATVVVGGDVTIQILLEAHGS